MNAHSFLPLLGELFAKSVLILAAAALFVRAWRTASAARRHLVWCVALGALLLLPATRWVEPRWAVPVMRMSAPLPSAKTVATVSRALSDRPLPEPALAPTKKAWNWPGWRALSLTLWAGGAMLILLVRVIAGVRLSTVRKTSLPIADERATALAHEAFRDAGVRRAIAVRVADRAAVPMTWGTWHPVVLLPADALRWTDARLLAALRHEAAHIARADHLVRSLAHIVCAVYWPNPLVWLAARRLRIAQEQATDDAVLRAGTAPDEYAEQLFEIARSLTTPRFFPECAVSMASPSTLEYRMLAIVDAERDRCPLTLRAIATGTCALLLVLGLATATQVQAQNPPQATNAASAGPASDAPARPAGSPEEGGRMVEIAVKFIEISFSGEQPALPEFLKTSATDAKPDVRVVLMDPEMQAALRALSGLKGVDLLSSPRIVTRSGERATIETAREFKYPTAFEKDPKTNDWAPTNFENRNVGIRFEVTPELKPNGQIALRIMPETTEFEGYLDLDAGTADSSKLPADRVLAGPDAKTFPAGHRKQPVFSTRKLTTEVTIKPGETVVLGALVREDVQKVEDRVPVLGDLPLVGRFFSSTTERHLQRRLFVFVTASLVEEKKAATTAKPQPLEITAANTSYDQKTGEAKASGNVEIKTPAATIRAERITIVPKPAAASPAAELPFADDPAARLIIPKLEFRDVKLSEAINILVSKGQEAGVPGANVIVKKGPEPEPMITLSLSNVPWTEALVYVGQLGGFHIQRGANAFVLEPMR